jgi:hypothetical protein
MMHVKSSPKVFNAIINVKKNYKIFKQRNNLTHTKTVLFSLI